MFKKDTSSYISVDPLKLYLFLEYLLNFHSNLYIPPWLWKIFKFMVFRLLEKTFVGQKIWSSHFYSCQPRQSTSPDYYFYFPRQREITPSSLFTKI